MTAKLRHHGLLTVPQGQVRPGIYWLRLFEDAGRYIAVVTEIPGNPAGAVTNAVEEIAKAITGRWGGLPADLVFFEVWPAGSPGWSETNVQRVQFRGQTKWADSNRAEIEELVGGSLPDLPAHEELYEQVLAIGGGVVEEIRRPVFAALPVEELPPPHNPSRCKHLARFRRLADLAHERGMSGDDATKAAGREFLASLTPDDLEACRFHRARWDLVANESVRIVDSLGRRDPEDYMAEARRSALPARERRWLESLFHDPIDIAGDAYTGGQHRGCALRFSGAERAAVGVGDESLGRESTDWRYEGDG